MHLNHWPLATDFCNLSSPHVSTFSQLRSGARGCELSISLPKIMLIVRIPIPTKYIHAGRGSNASLFPPPCKSRLPSVDQASSCNNVHGNILCRKAAFTLSPLPSLLTASSRGSRGLFIVQAVSVPDNADSNAQAADSAATLVLSLQLGGMFGLWYFLNIYFNIYNKQVLRVYPFPSTITAFQFGCGSLLVLLMWGLNLHPKPKITRSQFAAILPLAVAHAMGNVLTNVSLGKVAVSFTHTIKAMEPFFTVVLSTLFLGERPSMWIVSSLVPIVGGVALASFTEASFNWLGFCSAMASNLTNQSRNVLSKKFMVNKEEGLDNINLFSVITLICFVLLVPSAILIDGVKFTPSYLQSAASRGLNVRELCVRALVSGLCFHTYQQVSYMILGMVSAVSHSVGNCLKRVVVIVSSVIFFQTPISPLNSFGTALALAGVFLYSRAKQLKPKPKAQ